MLLLLVLIAMIVYFGINSFKAIRFKAQISENISKLPAFSFISLSNHIFSNDSLKDADRIIINYFSPSCDHCQYMAASFLKNKEKIKNTCILMVSSADMENIIKFKNDYNLNSLPNLILLRDAKFEFFDVFGTQTVPAFFIYRNKELTRKFIGETKIDNLLN